MSGRSVAVFLLAGVVGLCAAPARAQAAAPPASRLDVGIGLLWMGQQPLGSKTANETTGAGGTLPLFNTSSELAGAAGLAARVGVHVARAVVVEAEASYLMPQLRIAVSGDSEGAAAVTATERVQQFTVGGNVRWSVPVGRRWPRVTPFVLGGGGYLRQLHDQATLVETGRFYQFGGGATYLLGAGRHFHTKGVGVRADARAIVRSQGVALDGGARTSPSFGASVFVRF